MKKIAHVATLFAALLCISACGQKGPLIVEQPTLETPKTQDEELAPVR